MATTTVKWISGKQFIGIDSTKHSVVLSIPDKGVAIKPSELLPALASCTTWKHLSMEYGAAFAADGKPVNNVLGFPDHSEGLVAPQ